MAGSQQSRAKSAAAKRNADSQLSLTAAEDVSTPSAAAKKTARKAAPAKKATLSRAAPKKGASTASAKQAEASQSQESAAQSAKASEAADAANASLFGAFKIPGLNMPGMQIPGLDMNIPGMASMSAGIPEALQKWMASAKEQMGGAAGSKMLSNPISHAVEAMGQSLGSTLKSMAALSVDPTNMKAIQEEYLKQATELWNSALEKPEQLAPKDRRFAAPEWASNPGSAFLASMYLLNARTLQRMADSLQGEEKARERVRFAVQQWVDAASPANFLALNPEVQKKAVETRGESLTQGMQLLLNDLKQGHMSLTDESVFEVGKNVATTEGSVVFENEYFQLIEYVPLTPKVHAVPFMFVPPAINKFYILDLQPDNSVVRYLLSQGHRVFMLSWVNADDSLAKSGWDDYIEHGVIKAINTTREITGSDQINTLGFCVGGTLLATALAVLAGRGEKPAASMTLLTTFLDFTETGTLDIFIDEAMVQMREMTIGTLSPQQGGLMRGNELAATFSFLRANDLVWNYVVGNYLKGETPPAFDLLYWNSDSTNLPGPMYTWYLRNTYLENKLCKPGAVTVCGQPLDMRLLDLPTFVYASREDHIVPWQSAYGTTKVLQGPIKFVLGASGHIAGVINPPTKNKRSYWTADGLPGTAKEWFDEATENPGSWWPTWAEWLEDQAGPMVAAPKAQGSRQYPVIEPAPGSFVKRKA